MPNCCNPQGSNHHLPLRVEVLIGMLERNWKLVFILNAYLLEEKFKYNRSRILQVELDINKSEYIILHCIAERFYFLLFIRVRKMTKLLFIRAHMLQVEGWLPFSEFWDSFLNPRNCFYFYIVLWLWISIANIE